MNTITIIGQLNKEPETKEGEVLFNLTDRGRFYGMNFWRCRIEEAKMQQWNITLEKGKFYHVIGNLYQNNKRQSFVFVWDMQPLDVTIDDMSKKQINQIAASMID